MRELVKRCASLTIICTPFAIIFFLMSMSLSVRADGGSVWSNTTPPTMAVDEVQKPYGPHSTPSPECSLERVFLGNDLEKSNVCMVERDGWRFGKYTSLGSAPAADRFGYAIGFGLDTKMYRLRGLEFQSAMLGPNSNAFRQSNGYYEVLNILQNPEQKVLKTSNFSSGAVEYRLNWMEPDLVLKDPDGHDLRIGTIGMSNNGRWLAVEAIDRGIVFVDLKTEEIKLVSRARGSSSNRTSLSDHIAISDDGKYIATAGTAMQEVIITVDKDCGIQLSDDEQNHGGRPIQRPCEELDLWSYFNHNTENYAYAVYPVFGPGGGSLNINVLSYTGGAKWVTLKTGDDNPPLPSNSNSMFDYVALGDSYSSGEGDTEKNPITGEKYYLPFTDIEGGGTIPKEKCHTSSRSYPFVLRGMMGISADRMHSVACSGALVSEDYAQENNNYHGQGDRLSTLGSGGMIEAYKADALNEFIPGRNQQVEFVKKYQPKAITLTGGGNDAGFADVAFACALARTCDFADKAEGKAKLKKGIEDGYGELVTLYNNLHNSSPQTRIYALGYPQFFSDDHGYCASNVRFDQLERSMARAAVIYMNNTIEAAAASTGVKYIDIEQSFGEHVLCNRQESYVTGLAMSGKVTTNVSEIFSQESFHPNAKGHQEIAKTVREALENTRIEEYEYCDIPGVTLCPEWPAVEPEVPDFFAEAAGVDSTNYVHSKIINKDIIQKGKDILKIQLKGFKPNVSAGTWVFSNPINLGSYVTDANGGIDIDIQIPETLPAGAHTLQVDSQTFSGEPISLWQIIWVAGREGDVDEDNVDDATQACLFVSDSFMDGDKDGIDDACDPEVEPIVLIPTNGSSSSGVQPNSVVATTVQRPETNQLSDSRPPIASMGLIPNISEDGVHTVESLLDDAAEAKSASVQYRLPRSLLIALGLVIVTLIVLLKRIYSGLNVKR